MRAVRHLPVLVLVALLAAVTGCATSDDAAEDTPTTTAAPTSAPDTSEGQLFVVSASGGTLSDVSLELTGVQTDVSAFADRPARSTDDEPLADLVDGWAEEGFVDDPPNAAVVTRSDRGQRTAVVQLGQPVLSGDTLTFPATRLEAGVTGGATARLHSDPAVAELVEPSVFIDDGTSTQLVAVTIAGTWGAGDTRVALGFWDFSQLGGTWMGFQMGEPGTISFDDADSFITLTSASAISGTFSGVGALSLDSLSGNASLPAGSDLTIGACGPDGPTTALSESFDLELPDSC